MAIAVWPSDLPLRLNREGFSEGLRDGRLTTKMERGPSKMRRASSSDPRPIMASIRVTVAERDIFERFWEENGTRPFWMPDQTGGFVGIETQGGDPIYTGDGAPLLNAEWWFVMFGDARPSVTNLGAAQYSITFNLAVLV